MNFWLIVLSAQFLIIAAQVVASVIGSIRERGEDSRFSGAKVAFRS